MRNDLSETRCDRSNATASNERGSALVISLFVLALMTVFVALALSRTAAEANAVGNETAEARTLYAAQGSLEMMTRNFNKVFELKLNPSATDLNAIRNAPVPGLTGYTFNQELEQTSARQTTVLSGGPYSGLFAIRDNWRLRTTATDNIGVQVQLTRNILNSRVPIFQFGIFYDDDLELFRPPRFSFGGRVHSNRNFYISPGAEGVYFDSKVTTVGQIVTQSWRNWYTGDSGNTQTYIKNASGVDRQLLPTMGSVLNTSSGAANNIFAATDFPPSRVNSSFTSQAAIFDGNLQNNVRQLKLPLKVGNAVDLVEIIKRGKNVASSSGGDLWKDTTGATVPVTATAQDDEILRSERYANKPGIRVSLADSKAKLPGCASGVGVTPITAPCGVRLDGAIDGGAVDGIGAEPNPSAVAIPDRVRGYQPKPMRLNTADTTLGYVPTRVNGERLYTGGGSRQVWIKVELVSIDSTTGFTVTSDVTQDFLSLGMTEQAREIRDSSGVLKFKLASPYNDAPIGTSITATTPQAPSAGTDSRAVIKLQRFVIPGPRVPNGTTTYTSWYSVSGGTAYNVVERYSTATSANLINGACSGTCTPQDADPTIDPDAYDEKDGLLKLATVNGANDRAVIPFPIKLFDTREGVYYDQRSTTYLSDLSKLTRNGVMSIVDIDVANLRRFFRGDFNGLFPTDTPYAISRGNVGLRNADVPQREGWVVYVSDRRGDADFDGELDMEDIYSAAPGNSGSMQAGEDVNGDGILQTSYGAETERYNSNTVSPDLAAVLDHKYYRRGVRLINGSTVPGIYDSATPANTRGFSFASENGVYVQGNYNATGVGSVPSTGNTPSNSYLPYNTPTHIPASVVGDAVTALSNGWYDASSFASPYDEGGRIGTTTTMRFAMIAGDTLANKELTPNQGGISPNLNGGVHNFKRFLERWTGNRLDYSGSLINLFNSHNNNGSFKCCNTVYDPPRRNWVFDATFLDPTRMPPGTPFFQYVQTTGFQRTNS